MSAAVGWHKLDPSLQAFVQVHWPTFARVSDWTMWLTGGMVVWEFIPQLREQWFQKYNDILGGASLELLPLWEVNHRIPLIDEGKEYPYHLPRCLDSLQQQLLDKIWQHMKAGWWEMKSTPQATPILCIPKKRQAKDHSRLQAKEWQHYQGHHPISWPGSDQNGWCES